MGVHITYARFISAPIITMLIHRDPESWNLLRLTRTRVASMVILLQKVRTVHHPTLPMPMVVGLSGKG